MMASNVRIKTWLLFIFSFFVTYCLYILLPIIGHAARCPTANMAMTITGIYAATSTTYCSRVRYYHRTVVIATYDDRNANVWMVFVRTCTGIGSKQKKKGIKWRQTAAAGYFVWGIRMGLSASMADRPCASAVRPNRPCASAVRPNEQRNVWYEAQV